MSKPLRALIWALCVGLLLAPNCQPRDPGNLLTATVPLGPDGSLVVVRVNIDTGAITLLGPGAPDPASPVTPDPDGLHLAIGHDSSQRGHLLVIDEGGGSPFLVLDPLSLGGPVPNFPSLHFSGVISGLYKNRRQVRLDRDVERVTEVGPFGLPGGGTEPDELVLLTRIAYNGSAPVPVLLRIDTTSGETVLMNTLRVDWGSGPTAMSPIPTDLDAVHCAESEIVATAEMGGSSVLLSIDPASAVATPLTSSFQLPLAAPLGVLAVGPNAAPALGCTNVIVGTSGNDSLNGTNDDDCIDGLAGNDKLKGRKGDDTLDGGPDDDKLKGEAGDDELFGGPGDDKLEGGKDDDFLDGGPGEDELEGGKGDDFLAGGPDDDVLDGGKGFDCAVFDGDLADFDFAAPPKKGKDKDGDSDSNSQSGSSDSESSSDLDGDSDGSSESTAASDSNSDSDAAAASDRTLLVIDTVGSGGTDLVKSIECFEFDDQTVIPGPNDPPIDILLSNDVIEDGDPIGTLVGDLTVIDPDLVDAHDLTLVAGAGDADNGSFMIIGDELFTTFVADFFTQSSYSIRIRAKDLAGATFEKIFTITVESPNDPPVANPDTASTPEDTAVVITLTGSDPDSDPLTFALGPDPAGGTLSGLTPTGPTTADVTYTPDPDFCNDGTPTDDFTFTVDDGEFTSPPATVAVTVTCVNDAPTADPDTATTLEDTAVVISLTGSDPEGDPLTFIPGPDPAGGTLSGLTPTGPTSADITYTPDPNFCNDGTPTDDFTFTVSDGSLASPPATIAVTVTCVNDAPTADADTATTLEDTAVVIGLTGSDPDGDPLTFIPGPDPAGGTLSGLTPTGPTSADITYTPDPDFCNDGTPTDDFTFTVSDGSLASPPATIAVTVTCVNDAPTADADTATTLEDTAVVIGLTGSDPDGDPLTFIPGPDPAGGTLSGLTPTGPTSADITYTPDPNFCNDGTPTDDFTFTVDNGSLASPPATIAVTVTCVNDAPTADADTATTLEDTAVVIGLTGSDPDGDPLTFIPGPDPAGGTLSGLTPTGPTSADITYTPDPDFCNDGTPTDDFTFTVSDGSLASPPATIAVTVTCVNDAPTADADTATTLEDTAVVIGLTGSDPDGDPLTFIPGPDPAGGTLSGLTPTGPTSADITYTPDPDFCNDGIPTDDFTFTVDDGSLSSPPATIAVTVTCVNDAPTADADTATTLEDTAVVIGLTGSDPDGDPLTFIPGPDPAGGTLSGLTPTGPTSADITYTPDPDFFNDGTPTDNFTFTVSDGSLSSAPATVAVTVTGVNDAPTADADTATTLEDTAVVIGLTGSDPDGDSLTFIPGPDSAGGTLSGLTPTGPTSADITYTPDPDFCNDGIPTDNFTFTVDDGSLSSPPATIEVTVTCVNDAPTADADTATTLEDTAVVIGLTGSDPDGDPLTFIPGPDPAGGTLSGLTPTGPTSADITYTPDPDFFNDGIPTDNFTFTVSDGSLSSAPATVAVTVTGVNDAPTADADTATTLEDSAVVIGLTGSDPDFDSLTFIPGPDPAGGTLSGLTPTGPTSADITYTPDPDFCNDGIPTDDFTFTVSDGSLSSAPVTIAVTVTCVNDPPTAVPAGPYAAASNIKISFPAINGLLTNSFDDPSEGTAVSIGAVTTTSTDGDVVVAGDGSFTFDPDPGFTGPTSFSYTVCDSGIPGSVCSPAATVNLTVGGPTIWFVDVADATPGGDGRLSNPFQCLVGATCFSPVAADDPGDFIFLADGSYGSGLALLNSQSLIGDGSSGTLAAITGAAPPAGSLALPTFSGTDPLISGTGAGITLASGNLVRGLTVGSTTGTGIGGTGVGNLGITEASVSGSGRILDVNGGGTLTVVFDSLASTSSAGDPAIEISGVAGSFLVLNLGGVDTSIAAATRGISVQNSGGASFSFGDTDVSSSGAGVDLGQSSSNVGASFTFASLDVASSAGAGLLVDNSGSLNIAGTANTASAVGDSAVSITDTVIGTGGITFFSVDASGGVDPGLELVNTGSQGFTVAGNGAVGAGLTANNGTGGTITGMTSNCVLLDNVNNVSLNYMDITDCDDNGVDGTDVNGFVLTRSDVTGHADAGSTEAPLFFRGLTGTADGTGELSGGTHPTLIANSLIADGDEDNIQIKNETGTLARLEVRDSTIGNTSFGAGCSTGTPAPCRNSNDGINFEGLSSGLADAVMNLRVKDSDFLGNGGDHVNPFHNGTGGSMDIDLLENTMTDTQSNPLGVGGGITIAANDSTAGSGAAVTYDVAGNTIEDAVLVAIDTNLVISGAGMLMKGKIRDNFIGRTGAGTTECGSGSSTGVGIRTRGNRAGTHTVSITGNTIRNWTNGGGIQIQVRDGTGTLNATVTGNTEVLDAGCIAAFSVFGSGLFLESGAIGTDTNTLCIDAGGAGALSNTLVDPNGFDPSVVVLQNFATTMRFPTYAGAATNPTAHTDLNTFLGGRNSLGTNGVAADPGQGPTFQGGITTGVSGGAPSACPLP